MAIRIKLASTVDEFDELFRLRHRVFVEEEEHLAPRPDRRIYDRFDLYPGVAQVIALAEGRVVGGARYNPPSSAGLPTDEFFDFRSRLEGPGRYVGSGSMLVVSRDYRGRYRLAETMLSFGNGWASRQGLTHLASVSNPATVSLFRRMGHVPLSEPFFHEGKQLPTVPMELTLATIRDAYRDRVKALPPKVPHGMPERRLFLPGERLGDLELDEGDELELLSGEAIAHDRQGHETGCRLGPGDRVGAETSPRALEVFALSRVDALVLSRGMKGGG